MDVQTKQSPVTVTLTKSTTPQIPDSFKVDKPLLKIHPGDQVEFRFVGCKNPVIMIPVENVFTETIATDKNKPGVIRMNVRPDATAPGKPFPYMVYSPDTDIFAEGNSPPRMILDQKP